MGKEALAHIKNIALNPCGNSGEVIMAIEFDRRVEIDGKTFGFPISRPDVEALHTALGRILQRGRLISLPGAVNFR